MNAAQLEDRSELFAGQVRLHGASDAWGWATVRWGVEDARRVVENVDPYDVLGLQSPEAEHGAWTSFELAMGLDN